VSDLVFGVVGRAKTERVTKEGNHETVYRVSLKSTGGKCRLTLTDNDAGLLIRYPLNSAVPVNIGKSDQTTLTDDQIEEEVEKASADSQEKEE
jgi:hypothetical protein